MSLGLWELIILTIPVIIIILIIKSLNKGSNKSIVENIGIIAKYCRNCGKEVDSKAVACIGCGVPPLLENKYCYNCGCETESKQVICVKCGVSFPASNKGAGGIKWLCFFIPLVGLILYLMWKDDKPVAAKECGKFALIGVVIGIVIAIIGNIILYSVMMSSFNY